MPFLALPTKSCATTRESHPPSSFVRSTAAVCVVAGISEVHKTQPSNAVRRQTVGHLLPLPEHGGCSGGMRGLSGATVLLAARAGAPTRTGARGSAPFRVYQLWNAPSVTPRTA